MAATSAEGFYQIGQIQEFENLVVYAVAEGYKTVYKQVPLQEGQRLENVNLELKPGKFTTLGIVEDGRGAAVGGAMVYTRAWYTKKESPNSGGNTATPWAVVYSDASGRFSLATDTEGYIDILVNKQGYAMGFFPAVPVGSTDNRLVLEAPGSIAGTVRDGEGNPLPGMTVATRGSAPRGGLEAVVSDPNETPVLHAATDAQGRYRIDGLSSSFTYLVGVDEEGDHSAAFVTGVRVEPGETTPVDLTYAPLATLRVSVRSSVDGAPLSGIGVVVYSDPEVGDAGNTDASGMVALNPPVERGTALEVMSRLPCPTGFIDAEGPETKTSLTLSPGENAEVALTIHPPIRLPVRVVDEEGLGMPGMPVGLWLTPPDGATQRRGPIAKTGPEGIFVWETLPAGWSYRVFVADPDSGKTLAESGQVPTAIGVAVPEVVIRLITRGGIEGVVVNSLGQPFARKPLTITYTTASGEKASVRMDTREDGYFAEIQGPEARLHESLRFEVKDGDVEYAATLEGVELYSGQIVNVGEVVLQPASPPPLPARS